MSDLGNPSAWPSVLHWHFNTLMLICVVAAVVSMVGVGGGLNLRQRWSLAAGFLTLALLFASDVQARSMSSYRCHMIEHIIVVTVVAPIFAAAVRRPLSKPVATLGFLALTVVVPLYHLTRLGGLVMSHGDGHVLELVTFLVIGVWFWAPVYGANQLMTPLMRTCYVALAVPIIATTGLVLWSSTGSYLANVNMDMPALSIVNIHQGGVVMMSLGTLLMLGHVAFLALRSARSSMRHRVPLGDRFVQTSPSPQG